MGLKLMKATASDGSGAPLQANNDANKLISKPLR